MINYIYTLVDSQNEFLLIEFLKEYSDLPDDILIYALLKEKKISAKILMIYSNINYNYRNKLAIRMILEKKDIRLIKLLDKYSKNDINYKKIIKNILTNRKNKIK